ncbi:MAG: hypothetical protein RL014_2474 [Pseudomonadota bacterium]|jgi:folate-binding protein YgfZ
MLSETLPSPTTHPLPGGVCRLSHLGVIRAQGEEAAKFLHGQLTNDFALLGPTQARLAALCSPKGRMLASFVGFKRAADDIVLVCSADLLAPTLKRLSMFVLRAKVKLSDASADLAVWGLTGDAVPALAGAAGQADAAPWTLAALPGGDAAAQLGHAVRLYPADGVPRAMRVQPAGETLAGVGTQQELPEPLWLWGEVRSGVARVTQPVVDAFVPQMLNYESVGGVHFQKGCYPGQEVVARSQFRGTLKRRAYRVHIPAAASVALPAGTEVFDAADAEQPVGEVALVAATPDATRGGFDAIACLSVAAADGRSLRVGSASGAELRIDTLPYALRDDL